MNLHSPLTLQMATATAIRGDGELAAALCDLLDNGSRAALDSPCEGLALAQQTVGPTADLSARLQRVAAP